MMISDELMAAIVDDVDRLDINALLFWGYVFVAAIWVWTCGAALTSIWLDQLTAGRYAQAKAQDSRIEAVVDWLVWPIWLGVAMMLAATQKK